MDLMPLMFHVSHTKAVHSAVPVRQESQCATGSLMPTTFFHTTSRKAPFTKARTKRPTQSKVDRNMSAVMLLASSWDATGETPRETDFEAFERATAVVDSVASKTPVNTKETVLTGYSGR